jgi:D-glycero-alpha-D-manno-heptose-7-phosphate kinase
MIVTRSPLRVSLAGGGSDFPDYYLKNAGSVVSFAINKYVYVNLNKKFTKGIRFAYSITENVDSVSEIEHPLFKQCLLKLNINDDIEVTTIADVPAKGTGLASSSAFTAALLIALHKYNDRQITKSELAELVCEIEIEKVKSPIGKQDQFASVYGGLNQIQFNTNGMVSVIPIELDLENRNKFEDSILLLHTGLDRDTNEALKNRKLSINSDEKFFELETGRLKDLSYKIIPLLRDGNLKSVGELITESWMIKKNLYNSAANEYIDWFLNRGLESGAYGGKLLGAGDGGFIFMICPPDKKAKVINNLGLQVLNAKMDFEGSKVVYHE